MTEQGTEPLRERANALLAQAAQTADANEAASLRERAAALLDTAAEVSTMSLNGAGAPRAT